MEKSKVYYTDFRSKLGEGLPTKLKRLLKTAGMDQMDLENKFVAIKMHFGELGNLGFLRPNYARAVVDMLKEMGGKPYLTDCNTLYPGSRKNALEHLECAWQNGFTPLNKTNMKRIMEQKGLFKATATINGKTIRNILTGYRLADNTQSVAAKATIHEEIKKDNVITQSTESLQCPF